MSLLSAAAAGGIAAGALLVTTGVHQARPDPVSRGLGDRAPARNAAWPDQWLDRWSRWIGWERQADCLAVVGLGRAGYRKQQTLAALTAAGLAAAAAFTKGSAVAVIWVAVAVPGVLLVMEKALHRRAARVREAMGGQVLQLAEHLALAITAGSTPAEAIGRAADVVPEPLASWLRRARGEIRSGRSLPVVLAETSARLRVAEFSRLVDILVTASERGVPLAETLIDQVDDARSRHRSAQMESAGRAEVAMLIPVVLLVLPCVVVVALFPGAQLLGSF